MRNIRKRIAAMLIVVLCCTSIPAQAFAISNQTVENGIVELGDGYRMEYWEYSSGDMKFDLIKGRDVLASSYLDKLKKIVKNDNYINNETKTYNIADLQAGVSKVVLNNMNNTSRASATFITAGGIVYNLHRVREGVAYNTTGELTMQYNKTKENTTYDINQKVQDFTTLVAIIVSVFAFPAGIAATVAGRIMGALGIGLSVVNFSIKDYNVSAEKTTIVWRAKGSTTTISGDKYNLTYDDGSKQTLYEGDYYAETSIKNENNNFAQKVAAKYFPTFTATVKEWKK